MAQGYLPQLLPTGSTAREKASKAGDLDNLPVLKSPSADFIRRGQGIHPSPENETPYCSKIFPASQDSVRS